MMVKTYFTTVLPISLIMGLITALAIIGLANMARAQQQNPISPVEQRLVNTISALIFENARLSAELDTAKQTIAKLQAEKEEKK